MATSKYRKGSGKKRRAVKLPADMIISFNVAQEYVDLLLQDLGDFGANVTSYRRIVGSPETWEVHLSVSDSRDFREKLFNSEWCPLSDDPNCVDAVTKYGGEDWDLDNKVGEIEEWLNLGGVDVNDDEFFLRLDWRRPLKAVKTRIDPDAVPIEWTNAYSVGQMLGWLTAEVDKRYSVRRKSLIGGLAVKARPGLVMSKDEFLQAYDRLKVKMEKKKGRKNPGDSLKDKLEDLRPEMIAAAQAIYDQWEGEGDPEFGDGGICDAVSNALGEIIVGHIDNVELLEGGQEGDDHAWLIVHNNEEAYAVDIPSGVYESGGGYSWKKLEHVTFTLDDVVIEPVEIDIVEQAKVEFEENPSGVENEISVRMVDGLSVEDHEQILEDVIDAAREVGLTAWPSIELSDPAYLGGPYGGRYPYSMYVVYTDSAMRNKWINAYKKYETCPLTDWCEAQVDEYGAENWDLGLKLTDITKYLRAELLNYAVLEDTPMRDSDRRLLAAIFSIIPNKQLKQPLTRRQLKNRLSKVLGLDGSWFDVLMRSGDRRLEPSELHKDGYFLFLPVEQIPEVAKYAKEVYGKRYKLK